MASEMPVLPLVGSRIVWPGASAPLARAAENHRLCHAVLDAAAGVRALELGQQAHALGDDHAVEHLCQVKQRGIADRRQNAAIERRCRLAGSTAGHSG